MKNKFFLSFLIVFCTLSAIAQEMSIADIDNELYCQDLTLKLSGKRTDDFPFSAIYGDWLISVDAAKEACGNYGCYGKLENQKMAKVLAKLLIAVTKKTV